MGFAVCRFNEETGCDKKGSEEYHINLTDRDIKLNVPELWKHYMVDHLVQPTEEERKAVMDADPDHAETYNLMTMSVTQPKEIMVLYVEKTENGYTHEIGDVVDQEFVSKLEVLLSKVAPILTN